MNDERVQKNKNIENYQFDFIAFVNHNIGTFTTN